MRRLVIPGARRTFDHEHAGLVGESSPTAQISDFTSHESVVSGFRWEWTASNHSQ
jgi:hypothetical protein